MVVRQLALGVVPWLLVAALAGAQPPTPSSFWAAPLYDGTTGSVYLTWCAGSGAVAFDLERRVAPVDTGGDCDAGISWTPVSFALGGPSTDPETSCSPASAGRRFVDNGTFGSNEVCYRLRSRSSSGDSAWTHSPWISEIGTVNWPAVGSGTPSILHSYGTGWSEVGSSKVLLHAGVDLLASEGAQVKVVRGGKVVLCDAGAPNTIHVLVQVAPGVTEEDLYRHMWNTTCFSSLKGNMVSAGEVLGTVQDDTPDANVSSAAAHLHYAIVTEINGDAKIKTFRNPLGSGQDPHDLDVSVGDTGSDTKILQIVRSPHSNVGDCRDEGPNCETDFDFLSVARGDVDLVVDVSDLMSSNTDLRVAPYEIEAWVTQETGGSATIGSSTDPMTTLTLDSGEMETFNLGCVASAEHPATMGAMSRWPTYLSWIVTNAVNDGSSTDENRYCQFWRTKAKEGDDTELTGSDADPATSNSEARFPDGRYQLHVRARDLRQSVGPVTQEFVVDNFAPSIESVKLSPRFFKLFEDFWQWRSPGEQELIGGVVEDTRAAGRLQMTLEFSEPMRDAAIACVAHAFRPNSCVLGPLVLTAVAGTQDMAWTLALARDTPLDPGSYLVDLVAHDLAGNLLEIQVRGRASGH